MTNYITRFCEEFIRWVRAPNLAKPILEVREDGFCLEYRCVFGPYVRRVIWADVSEIHARMDDVLSLVFRDSADKITLVDETTDGWSEFLAIVLKRFPEFDMEKFREVEGYFASRMQGHQLCWSRQRKSTMPKA